MSGKEVSGLVEGRPVLNNSLIKRLVHELDRSAGKLHFNRMNKVLYDF